MCSSVAKGDDNKYHMLASLWSDFLLFHPDLMVASEVVHAIYRTIDKAQHAYTKTVCFADGTTKKLGQLERPFILFENEKPANFFCNYGWSGRF